MFRIPVTDFAEYEVISCDIFDTLLFRNCVYPKRLWRKQGRLFNFLRPKAELIARFLGRIKGQEEISIDDIYRFLKPKWKISQEVDLEISSLIVNQELLTWLKSAKSRNRKVLLISDFYMSSEVTKDILEKLNVSDFEVITSASASKTKSRGLFHSLIADSNIAPEKWLHIGDNEIADIKRPSELGINTIWYMPVFQQLLSVGIVSKKGLARLSSSFEGQLALTEVAVDFLDLKNEINSPDVSLAELVGGLVLAPVAIEIATWIQDLASKLSVSIICFIGRDGWIPFNAFKRLYPTRPAIYLETSRNAQQSAHFRDYLETRISGAKSVLIYDIGWRGSGLSLMQKKFDTINWYGSFLALVRQNRLNEFTYFIHCRKNWLWSIENRDILETLFSEDNESTTDYDETLRPIRSKAEKQDVQDFRKEVVSSAIKIFRTIKPEENYIKRMKILEMLCKYPSSKFASLFIGMTHRVNDSRIRPFVVNSLMDLLVVKDLSWWNGVKALRPLGKFKGPAWICISNIQKIRYMFRRALLRLWSRTS